jgi:acetyl esterase
MRMGLDPKIKEIIDQLNATPIPPLDMIPPELFRQFSKQGANPNVTVEAVKEIKNQTIPLEGRDIPVRMYTPLEGEAPYPALVFYHGGGWIIGDLDSYDSICRHIANLAKCKVISVDYRLAPEHKFPAAVHDAYDSFEWIVQHAGELELDADRLAIGGDSAGGNLAAVTAIREKENGQNHISFQWLLYPSTGYKNEDVPSLKENAEGYFLTRELMDWFRMHYFEKEEDILHPYASPIFFNDFKGLPPALIVTSQFDPLRDIGKNYADALKEAGVSVLYKNYEGLIHGFMNFHTDVPAAQIAFEEAIQVLADHFGTQQA